MLRKRTWVEAWRSRLSVLRARAPSRQIALLAVVVAIAGAVALAASRAAWVASGTAWGGLPWVDGALYLNLPDRPDRREQVLRELRRLGVGSRACRRIRTRRDRRNPHAARLEGHCLALHWFVRESAWDRVLVVEDDTVVASLEGTRAAVADARRRRAHGVFLARSVSSEPVPLRCAQGQAVRGMDRADGSGYLPLCDPRSAHGGLLRTRAQWHGGGGCAYVISRRSAVRLLPLLRKELAEGRSGRLAWTKTQDQERWFAPARPVCRQRPGVSDVLHRLIARHHRPP